MTVKEQIEHLTNEVKTMKAVYNNARLKGNWRQMNRCQHFMFSVEGIIKIMQEHNIGEGEAWEIADKRALASSAASL
jgi:hypothetical protein